MVEQFVHRPGGRSLARLGLAALLTLVVLTVAHEGVAFAQTAVADPDYWKTSADGQAIVERLVYDQSPQAIPAGYDPVREAEQVLAEAQRTLPASSPEAQTVWAQLRNLTVEEALSTAPRALGTIGLAAGTFYVGWKIGSGLNAKFLKIGVPEAIPHTNTDFRGNGFYQEIVWHAAGYDPEGGGKVSQPVNGFTWTRYTDSGRYSYWKTGAPAAPSERSSPTPTSHTATPARPRPHPRKARSSKASKTPSTTPSTASCATGSTTNWDRQDRPTRPAKVRLTPTSSFLTGSSSGRSMARSSRTPTTTRANTGAMPLRSSSAEIAATRGSSNAPGQTAPRFTGTPIDVQS